MLSLAKSKLLFLLVTTIFKCIQSAKVVTIGDSYASGNGIHKLRKEYDDTFCFMEKDTIPGGKYATSRGLDHIVTACSGDDVNETVIQWNDLQLRYEDEAMNLWDGSVIIVSTGGNSLRTKRGDDFEEGLMRCLTSIGCHKNEENEIENFDEVQAELLAFYTQLATEAAGATIRIMGYPKVFNSNKLKCFIPTISVKEANFFDNYVQDMNERIVEAIATVKTNFPNVDIQYVDLTKYFTNGACSPFKSRQIRDINTLSAITSFHPTQNGYDRAYGALINSLPA